MSSLIRPTHAASGSANPWTPIGQISADIWYVVIHTAEVADTSISAPSTHISIDMDGTFTQQRPLDQRIGLPGPSNWKAAEVLAVHSISVALEAPPVAKRANTKTVTPAQQDALEGLIRTLAASAPQLRDVLLISDASIGAPPRKDLKLDQNRLRKILPQHAEDFGPIYRVNIAPGDLLFVRHGPSQRWGASGALLSGDLVHFQTRAYRVSRGRLREIGWALVSNHNSTTPLGFVDTDHLIAVPNVDDLLDEASTP